MLYHFLYEFLYLRFSKIAPEISLSHAPITDMALVRRAGPRSTRSCELPGRCRCNQRSPNADARISIMARANAQGPDTLLQTDRD